jgi:glycosyltransferase involved in cell wall biosynthesis
VAERVDHEPMRIFYAGQLTQRKGLSYLFEALERFEYPYELSLAGPFPTTPCEALEAALAKPNHRWLGSLPHARLLKEMTRNHVLIFPSLVEGFGLVVTEALSAGLPVITTTNTCGPEIITNGAEGFIVPIRDPDSIAEKFTFLYECESHRRTMAETAKRKAAAINWTLFEDRLAGLVRELID